MSHVWPLLLVALTLLTELSLAQEKTLVPVAGGGRKMALVIGNSAYASGNLENPLNDAIAIRNALRGKGFSVEACCDDVGLRKLTDTVNDWTTGLQANDIAVFYYSGHGIRVDANDYMVPVDFPPAYSQADVSYLAYSLARLRDKMQERGTRINLIILDACRNNPLIIGKALDQGLAGITAGKGTLIMFAAAEGERADDHKYGNNSLFTLVLLQELNSPSISLRALEFNVKDKVYEMSKGAQLPYVSDGMVGDLMLADTSGGALADRASASPPSNSPTSSTLQRKVIKDPAEYNAYVAAIQQSDPAKKAEGIEAFMERYPNSVMTEDASVALMAAYQQAGNATELIGAANRALRINPNNLRALAVLAYYHRAMAVGNKAADEADLAMKYGQQGLAALPGLSKPEGMSDADFTKFRNEITAIFDGAVGFGALQKKEFANAQKDLREAVAQEGQPGVADIYSLATADLQSEPMNPEGFWFIVKAAQLAPGSEETILDYGRKKYIRYHGSEQGWNELVSEAKASSSIMPPAGFTVAAVTPQH